MAQIATLYPSEDKLKTFIVRRMFDGPKAISAELITHKNPLMVVNYLVNRIFVVLREEHIRPTCIGANGRAEFGSLIFLHLRVLNILTQQYADYSSAPSPRDVLTDVMGILKGVGVTLVPPPNLVP